MTGKNENDQIALVVAPAPHIHTKRSTQSIMYLVCIALLFPTIGGVYFFGIYSLFVVLVAVVTSILTEYISKMLRKREFVMDGSAIITGMMLALILPPRVPLWLVVIGSAFAIAIVKEAFGGLGHNIFNPALASRAFLSVTFAGIMTKWIAPVSSVTSLDSTTNATPLSTNFFNDGSMNELYWRLFVGEGAGSIGETSVLLILIGGLILLITGVIKWRIPTVIIGTVFLMTWIIPDEDPILHILSGGLFIGAFFMATDYVTIPLTDKGQYIFAVGVGVLIVLVRVYGSMPEGVAYAILLMNGVTPLIDRYVRPKPYGYVPPEKPDKDADKNTDAKDGSAGEKGGAKNGKGAVKEDTKDTVVNLEKEVAKEEVKEATEEGPREGTEEATKEEPGQEAEEATKEEPGQEAEETTEEGPREGTEEGTDERTNGKNDPKEGSD